MTSRPRAWSWAVACALSASLVATRARATCGEPRGPNGAPPPVTSDCSLDLVTSPVLSSGRIVALGGAYEALGEGTDGYAMNAAAPALRAPWSNTWADYDLDISITFPTAFRTVGDFENRGFDTPFTYDNFYFLTLGANLQLGAWGFGVVSDLQHYDLSPNASKDQEQFGANITRTHALLARSLFGGDLSVGAGLRIVSFSISRTLAGQTSDAVSLAGTAPEVGVLVRPEGMPFRIGATYRAPVTTDQPADPNAQVGGLVVPHSAHLPWEVDLGVALQGGPRPLNERWVNPHEDEADVRDEIKLARERRMLLRARQLADAKPDQRPALQHDLDVREKKLRAEEDAELARFHQEVKAIRDARYRAIPREYVLLTLGLLITGPTEDGISLESYFQQLATRAGRNATFSVRAGVETEILPNQLKLRLGTYIEPSRFGSEPDAKAFRQHVTGGFEVELFTWDVFGLLDEDTKWRLNTVIDLAPRWSNYGLSIGFWH